MKNEDLIRSLAIRYERYKDNFHDLSLDTIMELHDHITGEYYEVMDKALVIFVDEELDDFECVKKRWNDHKELRISRLNNNSDLFPGHTNLWFRAWHDYIHLKYDYPFTFEGEYKTYLKQVEGLSYKATQVLFSEIVMQTAYVLFYGKFAKKQKVVLIDIDMVKPELD